MPTSTTWRTLFVLVACFGFATAAHAQRNVTLRLNAATVPDTVTTDAFFEVRGSVGGAAPATLPDGNVINWGPESTIEPTNIGGDYFESTFQIPNDQAMEFKFWSQDAEDLGLGGWEDGGNHSIPAGTGDTTLTFHLYEKGSDRGDYGWRPWEQKDDTVAVWVRVFMTTEVAVNKGWDATADQMPGLRGDPMGGAGPLDWGTTAPILTQEGTDPNMPTYHVYSGVAYYPASLAGQTQEYKIHISGLGDGGWEDSSNRTFTVPASDSTLRWVLYSESPPLTTDTRVEAFTTFNVDVGPLEAAGLFDPARGDSIQVRGEFNGWNDSDVDRSHLQANIFNPALWQNEIPIRATVPTTMRYKFYLDQNVGADGTVTADWEEPLDYGGADREFTFTGNDTNLGTSFYNNIRPGNVIPEGTSVDVTFRADMSNAAGFDIAFDPSTDSVRVTFEDFAWEGLQAQNKGVENDDDSILYVNLSDDDGDMVYEGTYEVVGPTYNGIGYRLQYGNSTDGWNDEVGDSPGAVGRRRYQYVLPRADGSFAASVTLPTVPVQDFLPLPFECNPTLSDAELAALPQSVQDVCYTAGTSPVVIGVEEVDGELPTTLTLSQNYPNPFNPSTTFEYAVTRAEHVTVRVFDVSGRVVATLVDGVQSPSTYRVTFDAAELPSGVYLYQLQTPSQTIAKKMLLVK